VKLGTLYGIGVGPGDPELITLKGLRLLQQVPVVAYPAGIGGKAGIAQRIIAQWLQPQQTQLPLNFPYVQDETILSQAWQESAETVWHYLNQGQDVAFATEGDVSFYSTFTYLAQTLQQFHPEVIVKSVAGICSPMAAAAALGIPLTIQSQRLVILPALYTVDELEKILNWAEVVVLMKVSSVYAQVWQILHQRHLLANSWVIERATQPDQVIYTDLLDHPHLELSYFSLMIIQINPAQTP
jgi:precorrin-2/cobalt-factor-2 C20-methyltransferase